MTRRFSPPDSRRAFVGETLEAGIDIATLASIAGHTSVDTIRRPETTKQQAANKFHFPY